MTIPVCCTAPLNTEYEPASAPVCDAAALLPISVLPAFSAIIRFFNEVFFAISTKLLPSSIT